MEIKVNAIVLKAVDYKENDRILTLYSLENGKITAGIKGVKKAGAKLKFASEPFCFAEYILSYKNGRYTVIGASYIDTFYELRLSIDKYYTSAVVADFLLNYTESDMADAPLFSLALNAIKDICYNENEKLTLAKFLYEGVKLLGYSILNVNCQGCNEDIKGRVFIRFKDASFSCLSCKIDGYSEIREETYGIIKALHNDEFCLQTQYKDIDKGLKFLFYYIELKTDTKLKSIEAFEKIL